MRFRALVISCFLCCAVTALGQQKEPRLFDTITDNLPCRDAMARHDYFFAEITNSEPNLNGVAVYYEGSYREKTYSRSGDTLGERTMAPAFGEAQYRVGWLRNYVNFRGFPKDRLIFVSGGNRVNFSVDLWLVPTGSAYPKPEPSSERIKFRRGKFTYFSCH